MVDKMKRIFMVIFENLWIILLIVPCLYLLTYIYAFPVWNTHIDTSNPIYLEDEIRDVLSIIGCALIIGCIGYRVTFGKNKLIGFCVSIFTGILQILFLGLPGVDIHDMLPDLYVDALSRLENCIEILNRENAYEAVNNIEKAISCIYVIEIFIVILITVLLFLCIGIGSGKLYVKTYYTKGKKDGVLRCLGFINVAMMILVIIFHSYESGIVENHEFQRKTFLERFIYEMPYIGVIAIIFLLVIGTLIEHRKYITVAFIYVGCVLAAKNIAYHAYYDFFVYYNRDFWKYTNGFIISMMVGIIVYIMGLLWKYVVQRRIMKIKLYDGKHD